MSGKEIREEEQILGIECVKPLFFDILILIDIISIIFLFSSSSGL